MIKMKIIIMLTFYRLLVTLALAGLSLFMIIEAYNNWKDNPVLTTIRTTSLPIKDIEFPSITICGIGTIKSHPEIAYFNQAFEFLKSKGLIPVSITN